MGYDPDSELQAVTLTSGTSGFDGLTAGKAVTYGYDAAGNRTVEKTPNFQHTFGTNNLNQLNSETDNPISVVGSTNRPASVLVNATPVPENTNNQFQTSIPPIAGSSTPLTVLSVASDGTVATTRNHVLNAVPIQFDANGNCVKDSRFSYSWDAANRLIGISSINATPATVTDTIQMTYDGYGRRVGIVESHGSTVLTSKTFVWCGGQLCQERDSTGHTVTKQFFPRGELINGTNYYFAKDHLGSVREMTDSSGNIQANYDYDPWGRQTVLSQALTADFGYAGFYVNKTTGLDLAWYRAYDPEKGRWLSRDPLGEKVGINLFEYADNEPTLLVDRNGKQVPPQTVQAAMQELYNYAAVLCPGAEAWLAERAPEIWDQIENSDLYEMTVESVMETMDELYNAGLCPAPKPPCYKNPQPVPLPGPTPPTGPTGPSGPPQTGSGVPPSPQPAPTPNQ
jgi:RHS repeat-associated protein